MANIKLNVKPRPSQTKGYKHGLREQGKIPAVVYGKDMPNKVVEVDVKNLESILRSRTGRNSIIDLTVEETGSNKVTAMIRDIQRDPIKGNIVHADIQKIALKDKIQTSIPVHFIGTPIGVKKGGILQTGVREIEVKCIPTSLPDQIDIDVSSLDIGESITVSDVSPHEGCIITEDPDTVIVSVLAQRAVDLEEQPAAQTETAKPEPVKAEVKEKASAEKEETENK